MDFDILSAPLELGVTYGGDIVLVLGPVNTVIDHEDARAIGSLFYEAAREAQHIKTANTN